MLAGARVSALLTSTPARLAVLHPLLNALPECVHEAVIAYSGAGAQENPATLGLVRSHVRVRWAHSGDGETLAAALEAAHGDYLILNADHIEGSDLLALLGALLSGAAIAKGARFLQGGAAQDAGFGARIQNSLALTATRTLFGGQLRDFRCEALAISRAMLDELAPLAHERGADLPQRLFLRALKLGLPVREVPVRERRHELAGLHTASLPLLLRERFAFSAPNVSFDGHSAS